MKKSSLIGHTVEVYDLILRGGPPADGILDTFFRSHKYLGSHDRRFVAETVYGMLRHKMRLEWLIRVAESKFLDAPEGHHSLLLCYVYLVVLRGENADTFFEGLEPNPEDRKTLHLLINEAVSRNGALDAGPRSDTDPVDQLALEFSFPVWIVRQWLDQFGKSETEELCKSLNTPAPLTLRVNTIKATVEECRRALAEEKIETELTTLSSVGLTLRRRINVFQLEAFRKGFFEVQDEGSQLLSLLVDPKPRSTVVDACAGGGGKALAIASLMKNRGVIYALDINAFRLDGLRKRIRRSGVDTIRVRTVEEDHLPPDLVEAADNVLIDAPCSGLGTIRRNPGIKWSITPETVAELHAKQLKILDHYARCVRLHGRLIYATCTSMKSENEDVVEEFLAGHPQFEVMEPASILQRYQLESLSKEKYFRLRPHVHNTDGFFGAVMRRKT